MKRFSIFAVLMTCIFAIAFSGCSSTPAQSADSDSLKGFWVLDNTTEMGFDACLNLDEDELAELMIEDTYLEGTWTTDGKEATITFDSEPVRTVKVFVSEGKLALGDANGSKLLFVKGDMDEYFADLDEDEDGNGDELVIDMDEDEIVDEVIEDVEPVTLVDDDICTIVITGKGTDFTGDPGFRLSLKNNSDKSIYVTTGDEFNVGDKTVEPGLSEAVGVGETVESFIYFPKNDMGGGAETLKNITGTLIVGDEKSGDEIKTYPVRMR